MSVQKKLVIVPRREAINARFHEVGLPKSEKLLTFEQLDRIIRKHDDALSACRQSAKVGLTRGRVVCRREECTRLHSEKPFTETELLLHRQVWGDLDRKWTLRRDELRQGLQTATLVAPKAATTTVDTVADLVRVYLRASKLRGLAEATLLHQRHQLKHLLEFAGTVRISDIDRRGFDADFVDHLRTKAGSRTPGLAPSYLFQIHRISHVFWNWCVQNEYAPFALIRQKVRRPAAESKPLSRAEVVEVLAHLPTQPKGTQRIVTFLRYTGVRRAELHNLRLADIKLDPPAPQRPHCLLGTVQQTKTGGRGEVRTLDNPHLLEFLRKDLAARGEHEVWFLDNGSGKKAWTHSDGITRVLRRYFASLGIEQRQPCHCFRHSAAIELLEADVDLKTVADYLGHRSIQTTASRYLSAERVHARVADAAALLN